MKSEIYQFEMKRKNLIVGNLVGFTLWQIPYLVHYVISKPTIVLSGYSSIISVIGLFIWLYYNIRLIKFSGQLRKKHELARSLNDEYFQVIRQKSFTLAFWVLLGCIVILFVQSLFIHLNVQLVLHALIIIGVVSALISYLIFDKDN
ncbi:hypothetical protein V7127_20885 [Bacillus sp. JJ1773]|uniref:hypothetical protein n=1 Tax=Bacillus sp. JJ1773 TaxID=3122965 RepID=UPI002FFEFC94